VLVWHDLLGLYEGRPARFVRRYAELGELALDALERFAADVRAGSVPAEAHTYSIPPEELARFDAAVATSRE
jgi:3-methyl-2-oxobutanoate hydroxymethyltransferase